MAGSPLLFGLASEMEGKVQFAPHVFCKLVICHHRNFWHLFQLSGSGGFGHGIRQKSIIAAVERKSPPHRMN
jgi:hypothetical protein